MGIWWDDLLCCFFFSVYIFPSFFCMMKMGMYWEYDGNYWFTNHMIAGLSANPVSPPNKTAVKFACAENDDPLNPQLEHSFSQTSPQFVSGLEAVCEMNSQHLSTQLPTAYWHRVVGQNSAAQRGSLGFDQLALNGITKFVLPQEMIPTMKPWVEEPHLLLVYNAIEKHLQFYHFDGWYMVV